MSRQITLLPAVIDSTLRIKLKQKSQEDQSFHGNRRKDLSCRRRYSLLRADYASVVDACKERPDYILRQFGFWLDGRWLDCGADVGYSRAERTTDEFDFVDVSLLETTEVQVLKYYIAHPAALLTIDSLS
jgi:hypothetical protein